MAERESLRLPVVSAGAEYLVMGHLMRRNILAYKAPPNNEGYDLICIHPNPRHRPRPNELRQVRVQVKSRYATDCNKSFPVRKESVGAFDFLIIAFLNIGRFYRGHKGLTGQEPPEFYTLPRNFIRKHLRETSLWDQVSLKNLDAKIKKYKDEAGFERIAEALGVPKPCKARPRKRRRKG